MTLQCRPTTFKRMFKRMFTFNIVYRLYFKIMTTEETSLQLQAIIIVTKTTIQLPLKSRALYILLKPVSRRQGFVSYFSTHIRSVFFSSTFLLHRQFLIQNQHGPCILCTYIVSLMYYIFFYYSYLTEINHHSSDPLTFFCQFNHRSIIDKYM